MVMVECIFSAVYPCWPLFFTLFFVSVYFTPVSQHISNFFPRFLFNVFFVISYPTVTYIVLLKHFSFSTAPLSPQQVSCIVHVKKYTVTEGQYACSYFFLYYFVWMRLFFYYFVCMQLFFFIYAVIFYLICMQLFFSLLFRTLQSDIFFSYAFFVPYSVFIPLGKSPV